VFRILQGDCEYDATLSSVFAFFFHLVDQHGYQAFLQIQDDLLEQIESTASSSALSYDVHSFQFCLLETVLMLNEQICPGFLSLSLILEFLSSLALKEGVEATPQGNVVNHRLCGGSFVLAPLVGVSVE
jgi:hypothetical protein